MIEDPTPLTDPDGYLSLFKFNRRLRKCPRTGLSVSYADIGDPDGIPVLFVPPSGCSRWFAAPQDPLATGYGLRLIVVDRPGVGAVPLVPLTDRIEISCKLMVSVLEHLRVKPAHMVATSAGVYCALRLLSTYHSVFETALSPPPAVYLISPWSPPLSASDPLAYQQRLDWVPSALLTTQDITLPYVIPAVKGAEEAYDSATKAVGTAVDAVRNWFGGLVAEKKDTPPGSVAGGDPKGVGGNGDTLNENEKPGAIPVPDDVQVPADVQTEADADAEPAPRKRLWAPSAKYLTMDYLYAEDFRGIGQEHMMCLNRGCNTGPDWFVNEAQAVADAIKEVTDLADAMNALPRKDGKPVADKLAIDVWWGGLDGMVPRNGQEWLNRTLSAHPEYIGYVVHFVEDGSHADLMLRAQGIGEVYNMIMLAEYEKQTERGVTEA